MLLSFALLARPPPSNGNGRRLDCVVCKVWRCLSECLQLDFWKGCRSKKKICSIKPVESSCRQNCLRKTILFCFFFFTASTSFFFFFNCTSLPIISFEAFSHFTESSSADGVIHVSLVNFLLCWCYLTTTMHISPWELPWMNNMMLLIHSSRHTLSFINVSHFVPLMK